jgi:hypothetical protein
MSFAEAMTNVVVGYGIALATQAVLFPLLGLDVRPSEHIDIAGTFTAVSLARSFLLRRLFERFRKRHGRNETAAPEGGGGNVSGKVVQSTIR